MTSPSSSADLALTPTLGGDLLEQALLQARADGDMEGAAVLDTWLELRNLLRSKRPEQALTALEGWLTDLELPEGAPPPAAVPQYLPHTAAGVQAVLRDPQLPAHLRALGTLKRWQTPAEAEAALTGALAHPLTRAEALNLLGVLAAETGDAGRAAQVFAQALAADPGHYRALTNRAGLAAERGDDASAEADLRRALELNPDHHAAHQNLAVVLRRQGKRGEAVRALRRAQRLDYRQSGKRSSDQARRELAGLPRIPRAAWLALGLLLFFGWLWFSGGVQPA